MDTRMESTRTPIPTDDDSKYKTTRYRLVIITSIGLSCMMVLFVQFTMIPAARPIADEYGMETTTMVNMCCLIYFVMSGPAVAVTMWLV